MPGDPTVPPKNGGTTGSEPPTPNVLDRADNNGAVAAKTGIVNSNGELQEKAYPGKSVININISIYVNGEPVLKAHA